MTMLDVSKRDQVLFALFFLSLVLIAVLMGNMIFTLFATLIIILFFSFIDALIHVKSFNKFLLHRTKEISCALSFSILITLVFATVLPYLLFHNSFLNIFVIQYIYVFPILLTFFASFYFFNYLIKAENIQYKHLIKLSFSISIIISLVISIGLVVFSNYVYNERTEDYNTGYSEEFDYFTEKTPDFYPENLLIFNELKDYSENFLSEADLQRATLNEFDKKGCVTNACVKNIVNKAYHLVELVVGLMITNSNLEIASDELSFINEKGYEEQFGTLENYSIVLQQRVDALNYEIKEMGQEQKEMLLLVESDFNYDDLEFIQRENQDSIGGWFDLVSLQSGPLFYESISYVITHSTISQELVRLVVKVRLFTEQAVKNNELPIEVYQNKDINESIKSKTIRNKIILAKIDFMYLEDLYNNKS
jgi:hypothetical protein